MVNFPPRIPDCDSHSPAFLDLFLPSKASTFSRVAFPPSGNSDCFCLSLHWHYPSNSEGDTSFYHTAYDYSPCDYLSDQLRDAPWEEIFKLRASATGAEFCDWVQVGMNVYIPHLKYQVKHHLHGFHLLVLLHVNQVFRMSKKNKSPPSKVTFRLASL